LDNNNSKKPKFAMFREKDLTLLKEKGITAREAESQIEYLKKGFPFMKLSKAATINHGIRKFSEKELKDFIDVYDKANRFRKIKFVPASGAATRMFKALFEFDELFKQSDHDARILSKDAYKHVKECFDRIDDFAFSKLLAGALGKKGHTVTELLKKKDYHHIVAALLGEEGLNYGNLPKGLLVFHRYDGEVRTAVEEHLVEGSGYAGNEDNHVRIHLTVSPEHRSGFENLLKKVLKKYEDTFHVTFDISYSIQKPSTDTLAIDDKNEPFRESNGSLHFRPGGHGALLENLNELDADIIFIKNIDNVCHDKNKPETLVYKKALAGLLITYQNRVFSYIEKLNQPTAASPELIKEIAAFFSSDLGTTINTKLLTQSDHAKGYLLDKLNRPIRVCGMVKNVGEPGGGPFWTLNPDGSMSLQIVESSQVDHHDPEQEAILQSATHFNPVDLVCGIRNNKGKKFNLMNFRDPDTGFISKKFKNGKSLKALELPGLWNGSMSNWNTVFVEVPMSTFTPVKTVHDLLRPEHQQK
jgi:hypothetical protein